MGVKRNPQPAARFDDTLDDLDKVFYWQMVRIQATFDDVERRKWLRLEAMPPANERMEDMELTEYRR